MAISHSVPAALAVIALVLTIISGATGRVPLWVAVLLLNIAVLLVVAPGGLF